MSDTEPPTCVDCPADIVIDNVTETTIRVNWDSPTCTDNSGKNPAISTNRQRGDLFDVPGSYEVTYTATDTYLNKNENCSFRITLESKYFTALAGFLEKANCVRQKVLIQFCVMLASLWEHLQWLLLYKKKKEERKTQFLA